MKSLMVSRNSVTFYHDFMALLPSSTCHLATVKTWACLIRQFCCFQPTTQYLRCSLQCNFIIFKHRSRGDNKLLFDKQIWGKHFYDATEQWKQAIDMNIVEPSLESSIESTKYFVLTSLGWMERVFLLDLITPKGRLCCPKQTHIHTHIYTSHTLFEVAFPGNVFRIIWRWETEINMKIDIVQKFPLNALRRFQRCLALVFFCIWNRLENESRNLFSLKFKPNWKRDQTENELAHFLKHDQISAFLQNDDKQRKQKRWQKLPFGIFLFFARFRHTWSRQTLTSKYNRACLDPAKKKTQLIAKTKTGREMKNNKFFFLQKFNAVLSFVFLFSLCSARKKFHF